MATRSLIAKKQVEKDGTHHYESIYVHWDGEPKYRGPLLLKHFYNEERLDELLNLGDISQLGEGITAIAGTKAYRRDLGEDSELYRIHSSKEDLIAEGGSIYAEFIYLFEDGVWYVWGVFQKWIELAPLLELIDNSVTEGAK